MEERFYPHNEICPWGVPRAQEPLPQSSQVSTTMGEAGGFLGRGSEQRDWGRGANIEIVTLITTFQENTVHLALCRYLSR